MVPPSRGSAASDPSSVPELNSQSPHLSRAHEYESSDSDADRPDPDLVLDDLASRRFHSPSHDAPTNFAIPMKPLKAAAIPRTHRPHVTVTNIPPLTHLRSETSIIGAWVGVLLVSCNSRWLVCFCCDVIVMLEFHFIVWTFEPFCLVCYHCYVHGYFYHWLYVTQMGVFWAALSHSLFRRLIEGLDRLVSEITMTPKRRMMSLAMLTLFRMTFIPVK